jgi:integrase
LQQPDSLNRRRERVAPGIYLRDSIYSAGFSDPNTGRWTMPTLEATNLRDAKREREALIAALREGRAASKSTLDFDACLDAYLEALAGSSARERTVRHNRWVADRYLRTPLRAKPVQQITTADVRRVLRSIRHLSGWTQAKVVQVMREGFAVAIREDALVRSPIDKLDPRELPKPRSTKKPRRLTEVELDRFLAAAKTKTPGYHVLFVVLAYTGLRIREALALTWADVDLD